MKCSLVDSFKWSLDQIDRTDIESLIPFIFRFPSWKEENEKMRKRSPKREKAAFADELDL